MTACIPAFDSLPTRSFLPFSFATNPDFCAVSPDRTQLYLYPGPYTVGDRITIQYCPIVSSNSALTAAQWGFLNMQTDIPLLPEDAQDSIWMGAVALLNPKAREYGGGQLYAEKLEAEIARIREDYTRDSAGDSLVLTPAEDVLQTSGWDSWIAN